MSLMAFCPNCQGQHIKHASDAFPRCPFAPLLCSCGWKWHDESYCEEYTRIWRQHVHGQQQRALGEIQYDNYGYAPHSAPQMGLRQPLMSYPQPHMGGPAQTRVGGLNESRAGGYAQGLMGGPSRFGAGGYAQGSMGRSRTPGPTQSQMDGRIQPRMGGVGEPQHRASPLAHNSRVLQAAQIEGHLRAQFPAISFPGGFADAASIVRYDEQAKPRFRLQWPSTKPVSEWSEMEIANLWCQLLMYPYTAEGYTDAGVLSAMEVQAAARVSRSTANSQPRSTANSQQRSTANSQPRSLPCPLCDRMFADQATRDGHVNRAHHCSQCDEVFPDRPTRDRHFDKVHHKAGQEEHRGKKVKVESQSGVDSGPKFACGDCGTKFHVLGALARHSKQCSIAKVIAPPVTHQQSASMSPAATPRQQHAPSLPSAEELLRQLEAEETALSRQEAARRRRTQQNSNTSSSGGNVVASAAGSAEELSRQPEAEEAASRRRSQQNPNTSADAGHVIAPATAQQAPSNPSSSDVQQATDLSPYGYKPKGAMNSMEEEFEEDVKENGKKKAIVSGDEGDGDMEDESSDKKLPEDETRVKVEGEKDDESMSEAIDASRGTCNVM